MKLNLIGAYTVNAPFGTEIAFAKGLRAIGCETVDIDCNIDTTLSAMDLNADVTVVFKSCVGNEEHLRRFKGPIVVYQADDARFSHIREMMLMMRQYGDLFLSFDDYGCKVAETMRYHACETLMVTADPELYCPSPEPTERDIDVSFIGSLGNPTSHASRHRMLEIVHNEANKRGWSTAFGSTQDLPKIIDVYRRSKIVLNHATDVGQPFGMGYGLQCRHFEVALTNTALLSNAQFDKTINVPCATFTDEQSLIHGIENLLENDHYISVAKSMGEWVRNGNMPEDRARQMVDFIRRNS